MQSGQCLTAPARRSLPCGAEIEAHLQPVIDIASGGVVGFEALARLRQGDRLLAPAAFLPAFSAAQRADLFTAMLGQAVAFIGAAREAYPRLTVSVNVEASLLLGEHFCDRVAAALLPRGDGGPAIRLELLEGEQITDFARAEAVMARLKALGVGLSLDDVGSAYSSLLMIKRLPIDVIKLDQAFARELPLKPETLQFVHSMVSLARGLGKTLLVEGVETPAILNALAIMGVDQVQGYAVAKPMPADHALPWLAGHRAVPRGRSPQSLLAAYAAHLTVVEACRVMRDQSLPVDWREEASDPHACGIGRFLDRCGCHDTAYGLAHKAFHRVITRFQCLPDAWGEAADRFRDSLREAILAGAG